MVEAVQAAGHVIGGVAGYEQGRWNAGAAETEAVETARAGAGEEARVRETARMAIGQQLAAQGAGGLAMGTGSALDALTQSQVNAALDALTVRDQAARRARAARVSGAIARAQGENALVQGMFGAASSVARGRGDWAAARSGTASTGGGGGGGGGGRERSGGTGSTDSGSAGRRGGFGSVGP